MRVDVTDGFGIGIFGSIYSSSVAISRMWCVCVCARQLYIVYFEVFEGVNEMITPGVIRKLNIWGPESLGFWEDPPNLIIAKARHESRNKCKKLFGTLCASGSGKTLIVFVFRGPPHHHRHHCQQQHTATAETTKSTKLKATTTTRMTATTAADYTATNCRCAMLGMLRRT